MNLTLADLGWSDHFARQAAGVEATPARIAALHRDRIEALSPEGPLVLVPHLSIAAFAVGDWVLARDGRTVARLEPRTVLSRRGAGTGAAEQFIAANVDTLAIVSGATHDFNVARLERYLALALSAGVLPLIVLTRADEAGDVRPLVRQAERLSPLVTALALDARDPIAAAALEPWCRQGQTLAFIGSSGVGKTTLRNHLTGEAAATAALRADDAKGRHTTTSRALVRTRAGGWIVDMPGMRELRMLGAEEGISAVFDGIEALAAACRFSDCAHDGEPGCAIAAAIADGTLEPARLDRWRKLKAENAHNSRDVAEARAHGRALNRLYRSGHARARAKRRIE